jgi:hypothetical protein
MVYTVLYDPIVWLTCSRSSGVVVAWRGVHLELLNAPSTLDNVVRKLLVQKRLVDLTRARYRAICVAGATRT